MCFMDVVVESGHFNSNDLVVIGTCRKYKAYHMRSCLVRCNGIKLPFDFDET